MRALVWILGVGLAVPAAGAPEQPLFNGRNLEGWWAKDGKIEAWRVESGAIVTPPADGGWLSTEKEYGDFVLKLECRIEKGGNSGVGLRFPREGRPWLTGVEIQILDDDDPKHANLKAWQYSGSVYGISPPLKRAARAPGEWNALEITCRGPVTEIKLNGQLVNRVNAEELTVAPADGPPLKERPRRGHIGLQAYGPRTEFRNISVRVLE